MSFEKYFNSLGPEKTMTYGRKPYIPNYEAGDYMGYYGTATRPNVAFGTSLDLVGGSNTKEYTGFEGYQDSDGNFLGYGSDADSVYNNSPDLQRQYQEYVEKSPQRAADDLRNAQLAEEYRILQQQALAQERTQTLPALANFNPAPQMGGGLIGQQPMQPMQQQQQMPQPMQQQPMQQQGGLMNYTHRGNMGGTGGMGGTAGGLHRGGLIAPSGSNGGGQ